MIKHLIAYEGVVGVSLAVMQEEYMPTYAPWPNRRIGVEGTLQRPPYSIPSGKEWIRDLDKKKGKEEVFAVLLHTMKGKKPSYRYVGHTGIHQIMWPDARAKTGSIIGDPRARGRGCGTEAKLLLQYHAFMVLGLRKLISTVKAFNAQSVGHLIKCGYKPVGRYKNHIFHEGRFVDEILFEVFKEDWEPIWKRYQETRKLPKLTQQQRAWIKKEMSS